jgi:hypothetical protein
VAPPAGKPQGAFFGIAGGRLADGMLRTFPQKLPGFRAGGGYTLYENHEKRPFMSAGIRIFPQDSSVIHVLKTEASFRKPRVEFCADRIGHTL